MSGLVRGPQIPLYRDVRPGRYRLSRIRGWLPAPMAFHEIAPCFIKTLGTAAFNNSALAGVTPWRDSQLHQSGSLLVQPPRDWRIGWQGMRVHDGAQWIVRWAEDGRRSRGGRRFCRSSCDRRRYSDLLPNREFRDDCDRRRRLYQIRRRRRGLPGNFVRRIDGGLDDLELFHQRALVERCHEAKDGRNMNGGDNGRASQAAAAELIRDGKIGWAFHQNLHNPQPAKGPFLMCAWFGGKQGRFRKRGPLWQAAPGLKR